MRSAGTGMLVALVLVLAAPTVASAAVVTVNDDTAGSGPAGSICSLPTFTGVNALQTAIDASSTGDTLLVCAGTYSNPGAGPAGNVTDRLTIRGAGAGVDGRTRATADESVLNDPNGGLVLAGGSDGSVIDGFTAQAGATGISVQGDGSTLVNNIIAGNTIGLFLNNAAGPDDTSISRNRFVGNNLAGPSAGNGIYGDANISDVAIEDNSFSNNVNGAITLVGTGPGALKNDVLIAGNDIGENQITISKAQNVDILRNANAAAQNHAVQLSGGTTNVDVRGNSFTANNDGWSAIRISSSIDPADNSNIQIRGNNLTGPTSGVGTGAFGINVTAYTGQLEVAFNRIVRFAEAGLQNDDADADVDARNNWWGCNAGPNNPGCDTVEGSNAAAVDFTPFLVLRTLAAPTSIPVGGSTSAITADLTTNSAGRSVEPDFPDGVAIAFVTTAGTLDSATAATADGRATRTLTSAASAGTATVSTTLDNATTSAQVVFTEAPTPPGPPNPPGPPEPPTPPGQNLRVTLSGRGSQDARDLEVGLQCSQDCSITLTGSGTAKGGGGERFSSKTLRARIAPGAKRIVDVGFRKKDLKRITDGSKINLRAIGRAGGQQSGSTKKIKLET